MIGASSVRRCPRVLRCVAVCVLPLAFITAGSLAGAQEITSTLLVPSQPVPVGSTISVWLVFLNTSDHQLSQSFPSALELRLRAGTIERTVSMQLRKPAEAGEAAIPPGGYVRREYAATLPGEMQGPVTLSVAGVPANPVVVQAQMPQVVAAAPEAKPETQPPAPERTGDAFDPQEFFKEQFFGYEPFYFIFGTKSPNAKFQLSFKYRLFSERGWLVKEYPALKGFHLAYTQTSLWDWNAASAPFLDSSYKPEFFYEKDQVDGGFLGKWARLDLQGGVQHESNGKGGSDSRSLNVAYLQPTFVVGEAGGLQLRLAPRGWVYLGSLSDNPDIQKFRGYVGLRAVAGWADSLQLSATGRLGDAWDRGSLQLDLTYPLMSWVSANLALYLHVQYFFGYGETLLRYNDRSSSLRVGLSLFR
jgi:phospholipase A1